MSNLYTFVIDTDTIKSDNTFSISAPSYREAIVNLFETIKVMDFTYLNIVLVYTNDKIIKETNEGNIKF